MVDDAPQAPLTLEKGLFALKPQTDSASRTQLAQPKRRQQRPAGRAPALFLQCFHVLRGHTPVLTWHGTDAVRLKRFGLSRLATRLVQAR